MNTEQTGENKLVLCAANSYEKKYYLNPLFKTLPDSIKDELQIICVTFTEQVGGIISVVFEEDGILAIETDYAEDDFVYDEINSGLRVNEMRRSRQELFESLSLYYKVFILKEDIADLLEE